MILNNHNLQEDKQEYDNMIKARQHLERRKQIRTETAELKKKFREKWTKKRLENMKKAKIPVDKFFADPLNAKYILRKWMQLKDEFFEPPVPGTYARTVFFPFFSFFSFFSFPFSPFFPFYFIFLAHLILFHHFFFILHFFLQRMRREKRTFLRPPTYFFCFSGPSSRN